MMLCNKQVPKQCFELISTDTALKFVGQLGGSPGQSRCLSHTYSRLQLGRGTLLLAGKSFHQI